MHNGRVVATTPDYAEVNKLELARGRFLIEEDDTDLENYCVLGSEVGRQAVPVRGPARPDGRSCAATSSWSSGC